MARTPRATVGQPSTTKMPASDRKTVFLAGTYVDGIPPLSGGRSFGTGWLLVSDERARQTLRFLSSPLWRAYTSTYVEGYRLLRAWLDDRPADVSLTERFGRLLDEPLIPSALRAA